MPERLDAQGLQDGIAAELSKEARRSPEVAEREAFAEAAALLNSAETAAEEALAEGERVKSHAMETDHPDHRRGLKISFDPALARRFDSISRSIRENLTELRQRMAYTLSLGSPFAPGEEFNVRAAWHQVKHSPREERPRNVKEFKHKAQYQHEGLALLEEDIRNLIREDPDIGFVPLARMFEERASAIALGAAEKEMGRKVLHEYTHRHAVVRRYGIEFKHSSEELYARVFGRRPEGPVQVFEFPVSLHFRCEHKADYEHLVRASFKPDTPEMEKEVAASVECPGVLLPVAPVPELRGMLTAGRGHGHELTEQDIATMTHEASHAWNRLFFMFRPEEAWRVPPRGAAPEEKRRIVLENMRRMRRQIEDLARDEIIALLEDGGEVPIPEIFSIVAAPAEDGGGYDYFARRGTRTEVRSFDPSVSDADIDLVFREEYHKVLEDAKYAVNALALKGWNRSKIAAFLRTTELRGAKAALRHGVA